MTSDLFSNKQVGFFSKKWVSISESMREKPGFRQAFLYFTLTLNE